MRGAIPPGYLPSIFLALAVSAYGGTIAPFDLALPNGAGSVSGTTIASGLDFTYGMALLPDGSLVYGSNAPTSPYGIAAGPSNGSIWVLPKETDGSFGAPYEAVANAGGVVTNIRNAGNLTVVDSGAASTRTMSFYDQNFNLLGSVSFNYPNPYWEHSTGMSLISPQPDGSDRIFFIVGSETDQTKTTDQVTTSGLFSATLNADSVYMVTVNDNGGTLSASSPTQVATGLRNAYGLTLDSAGDLIIGENGQDGAHIVNETSADTLDLIPSSEIGTTVFDFGFPDSYVDFATGAYIDGDPSATPPLAAFLPVAGANGMLQSSEGLAGMAFVAPGTMPFAGPLGGEIVGFDGVSPAGGAANYDNTMLYYDFASGQYYPLVDAGLPGVGHLNTVLVSGNTIFMADTSIEGDLTSSDGANSGAIYEFTVTTPEPGAFWLCAGCALSLSVVRLQKRKNCT
jgi:glucose/arabinose dehydrogenase